MFIKLVHRNTLSVEAIAKRVPNGDLIIICTCDGVTEPAIDNQVYIFRSKDNGRTWEQRKKINKEDGLAHYQTETSVFGDEIRVFITKHNGKFLDWQNYCLVSKDSGETWHEEQTPCLPSYAFVRGGIALSSGRILYPYHFFPVTEQQIDYCKENNLLILENDVEYLENGVLISDDNGKSFQRNRAIITDKKKLTAKGYSKWIWNENTIIELEPGHIVMLYRLDGAGFLWRADSYDYGTTWSKGHMTDIANPSNKPFLLKTPKGEIVLINTHQSKLGLVQRHPLEIWVSADNMKTWYKKITLSNFPGIYSYAAGFAEDDNHVRLAFEFNRHDVYYAEIDLNAEYQEVKRYD